MNKMIHGSFLAKLNEKPFQNVWLNISRLILLSLKREVLKLHNLYVFRYSLCFLLFNFLILQRPVLIYEIFIGHNLLYLIESIKNLYIWTYLKILNWTVRKFKTTHKERLKMVDWCVRRVKIIHIFLLILKFYSKYAYYHKI